LAALLDEHIPLYVASATPVAELKRIIEGRQITGYFKDIYGSPASKGENIAHIVTGGGYDPQHVLMVGDALSDYQGAQQNSVPFIGRVPTGQASPFPAGTVEVENMAELQRYIEG
jgi:phosphoglycolate phosphatase-like HAD superfamily hydrolase